MEGKIGVTIIWLRENGEEENGVGDFPPKPTNFNSPKLERKVW